MTRATVSKVAGIAAAVLFTLAAALEIERIAGGRRFHGMVLPASYVLAALFAALWLSAATACLLRHKRIAAVVAILGTLAFLPHSVLQRLGSLPSGLLSLAAFAVVIVLVRLTFLDTLLSDRTSRSSRGGGRAVA